MGSQSLNGWSRFEIMAKEEDDELFSLPTQLPSLDFSSAYSTLNCHSEFPIQETAFDAFPLSEMLSNDQFNSSMDLLPSQSLVQDEFSCEFGFWNEMNVGFDQNYYQNNKPLLLCDSNNSGSNFGGGIIMESMEEERARRCREEKGNSCKLLSRNTISQYFYMPITQAAKELNVGLTFLKKRCRELGIRRWPHRKLMSLQTLIKNVQELRKEEGEGVEEKLREAIEILERERKLMEEIPDMQLEDKTKRLRQACFKANYKKRKLMGLMESHSSSSNTNSTSFDGLINGMRDDNDEEEEMRSLFSQCFSSTSLMFKGYI